MAHVKGLLRPTPQALDSVVGRHPLSTRIMVSTREAATPKRCSRLGLLAFPCRGWWEGYHLSSEVPSAPSCIPLSAIHNSARAAHGPGSWEVPCIKCRRVTEGCRAPHLHSYRGLVTYGRVKVLSGVLALGQSTIL